MRTGNITKEKRRKQRNKQQTIELIHSLNGFSKALIVHSMWIFISRLVSAEVSRTEVDDCSFTFFAIDIYGANVKSFCVEYFTKPKPWKHEDELGQIWPIVTKSIFFFSNFQNKWLSFSLMQLCILHWTLHFSFNCNCSISSLCGWIFLTLLECKLENVQYSYLPSWFRISAHLIHSFTSLFHQQTQWFLLLFLNIGYSEHFIDWFYMCKLIEFLNKICHSTMPFAMYHLRIE